MKKNILSILLLVCIFFILVLFACKKSSSGSKHSPADGKFRFTYNGIKYELLYKDGDAEWAVDDGIYIYRPDLFGGVIYFPYKNCAYLDPDFNIMRNSNCELTRNGGPIDSTLVYLYQSGSFTMFYSNCYQQPEYDIVTGSTYAYDVCDVTGTFDLTLKNSEGKTIVITDGSFEEYSLVL